LLKVALFFVVMIFKLNFPNEIWKSLPTPHLFNLKQGCAGDYQIIEFKITLFGGGSARTHINSMSEGESLHSL
jgi:hypothetical protein